MCMAVSALVSFTFLYAVSFLMTGKVLFSVSQNLVISFAPSLMMSLLVAMSIDYSLFLLTRFREQLIAGKLFLHLCKSFLRR